MKNRNTILTTILLALGSFALSPIAQAVVPAPDGGYAGNNTAEGQNALLSLTSGTFNTAVGWLSLKSDTTGQFNTALGAGALFANTGDQNTATGARALFRNSTGFDNTADGTFALLSNTTGSDNTATGYQRTPSATPLRNSNTADGVSALANNTTGQLNTAVGASALLSNTTGNNNTANGVSALASTTTGQLNTAIGASALLRNTTGNSNTANGVLALANTTTGQLNTAIGASALLSNTTGNSNIALGFGAGADATHGNNNVYIGTQERGVAGESDTTRIRNILNTVQPFQSNVVGFVTVGPGNRLGNGSFSSRRYKDDIKPMDKASDEIFALKPVSFRYKKEFEPTHSQQYGLIAEDVAKVDPNLVVYDEEGKVRSVRYDVISNMLLNEFLKEHRKNEQQEATIARQEKQIEALTGGLQKVSVQLEMNRSTKKVVLNNQ